MLSSRMAALLSPPDVAGSGPSLELLPKVLEFVAWDVVVAAVSCVCSAWCEVAGSPRVWGEKHLQHFGWASRRLREAEADVNSLRAFGELRLVQMRALAGRLIDMRGEWLGRDIHQTGNVFRFRLTLHAGEAGQALWRGLAADGPFWDDRAVVSGEVLDEWAARPAEERFGLGADPWLDGRSAAEGVRTRGVHLQGDGQRVGGYIEWFVDESSEPTALRRMQGIAMEHGIQNILHRRAIEYVCGLFLPSSSRLLLAGTHVCDTGRGVLGLDQYDLVLDPDGLRLEGVTRGHHSPVPGVWLNVMQAWSVELPSMLERAAHS